MVDKGSKFPDFTINDHTGKTITLKDLNKKRFVVFAYPKADTPGCTKEACSVRDFFQDIQNKGVQVFGLSKDSEEKNAKFATKYNLIYSLLSDPDRDLIEKLGLWGEKKYAGKTYMGVARKSFVVDTDGTIVRIFNKVKTATHGEELLETFAELGW